MGTRGLTGFKLDGRELLAYQQYDSYPDGVGVNVLGFARRITDLNAVKERVRSLKIVDESADPTPEERAALEDRYFERVSTGQDWYAVLRKTQGDPELILESGHIAAVDPATTRSTDDVWLEYSWLIDLDAEEFIGYEGNLAGPVRIRRPLSNLPTDEELIAAFAVEGD